MKQPVLTRHGSKLNSIIVIEVPTETRPRLAGDIDNGHSDARPL